jgi:hypothetical protein
VRVKSEVPEDTADEEGRTILEGACVVTERAVDVPV